MDGVLHFADGSTLDTSTFLLLAGLLFVIGAAGVMIRRNPLVILV